MATPPRPSSAATSQADEGEDKLRDGPCSHHYSMLMACSDRKDAVYGKKTMEACPSETDLLLKCVHKHPAYFLKKQP